MEKTWMPTAAGILDIVAGALSLLGLTFALFGILVLGTMGGSDMPAEISAIIIPLVVMMAIFAIIADILAIVGGTFALRRRKWGLALAGCIAAFFAS